MECVSSEDGFDEMSERFECYSFSTDISKSESSSSSFSYRHFDDREGFSTCLTYLPLLDQEFSDNSDPSTPVPIMLPVVGNRHVAFSVDDAEKPEAHLAERSKLLAHRANTILQNLKLRFPNLPQTALDMSKIQYNKDVGQSILESYSRVMESLAFNIIARIDDLLYVDDATKQPAAAESTSLYNPARFNGAVPNPFHRARLPLNLEFHRFRLSRT